MSYGWEVFNVAGAQVAGSTKKLLRFAFYQQISANGSHAVSGLVAASAVAFAYPLYAAAASTTPWPTITVTDGNVAWSRSSWGTDMVYALFVVQWK